MTNQPLIEALSQYCQEQGVELIDVFSKTRKEPYKNIRHNIYFVLRMSFGMTYEAIAAITTNEGDTPVNHATVMHGVHKIESHLIYDDTVNAMNELRQYLLDLVLMESE